MWVIRFKNIVLNTYEYKYKTFIFFCTINLLERSWFMDSIFEANTVHKLVTLKRSHFTVNDHPLVGKWQQCRKCVHMLTSLKRSSDWRHGCKITKLITQYHEKRASVIKMNQLWGVKGLQKAICVALCVLLHRKYRTLVTFESGFMKNNFCIIHPTIVHSWFEPFYLLHGPKLKCLGT